jgi:multiple sugar transport system permease protein
MQAVRSVPGVRLKRRRRLRHLPRYVLLIGVTVLISVPLIWLVITSLKVDTEYMAYPITFLPAVPQWGNYVEIFAPQYHFLRHVGYTTFLALAFSTITVGTSSMFGFAFARFSDVKACNRLFALVVGLIIIPSIVTVIPQFIIFARLHLTGTYWPWILWGLAGSPFHIFLFRQFFLAFPKELEDAAEVDGCSPFGTFWRIFLPNAKPVVATSFILNFVWVWGDWFTPLIYLRNDNTMVSVILNTAYKTPTGQFLTTLTLAAVVIYILPMMVIFFLGQRYILQGVITTGLAGR